MERFDEANRTEGRGKLKAVPPQGRQLVKLIGGVKNNIPYVFGILFISGTQLK